MVHFLIQVTWVPHNGTLTEPMTATFNSSTGTSYTITNLHRLTLYSVSVYATNSNGRGMRSSPVTITTSATCKCYNVMVFSLLGCWCSHIIVITDVPRMAPLYVTTQISCGPYHGHVDFARIGMDFTH